jgi:hypothetical protein
VRLEKEGAVIERKKGREIGSERGGRGMGR